MQDNDPFVTRAELREKKKQFEAAQREEERKRLKESEREFIEREKEIDRFYRKEFKKKQPIKQTRSGEKQRSRKMNSFLGKAIFIVILLICLVVLAINFI